MKNKPTKIKKESIKPRQEGFFPFLLAAVAMATVLIALVINKFFFPFSDEPLSPIIAQILILLVPTYVLLTISGGKRERIGINKFRAVYIILTIFAACFAICSSFILNMIFGGTLAAAKGFTILGLFCAGKSEFTVSLPYLIVTYAIIPAIIEELAFRGFVFSNLRNLSVGTAVVISLIISALFFFSPTQIPDALVCSIVFSFLLITTNSLIAPIVAHLILNLFRLFLQTNMSVYFTSAQNIGLLVTVVVLFWLLSGSLFFAEAAKIFRARAHADVKTAGGSKRTPILASERLKKLFGDVKSIFTYRPTLITAIVTLVLYIAITIIGII